MAYHSSVGCDRRGDQPTGYATPSACFHTPEITITPQKADEFIQYMKSELSNTNEPYQSRVDKADQWLNENKK
ncbi:hypothetical protein GUE83_024290 (plasmid) [Salmonella enterica subsp. enterica serovar Albany]|nr:hypothetical protein GUE83_024290 [Salmonella enterica subsp. enterica serovar Albany]